MKFFLGTHRVSQKWWNRQVPLFVSRRILTDYRTLPVAQTGWALDSGGFTELNHPSGQWQTTEDEYVDDVLRFQEEVGCLEWVAPMDWMCEPTVVENTGLSVPFHQQLTVENFLSLRERLGDLVIPVLQGWTQRDYHHCWGMYEAYGVDLAAEPLVGLGTICRRQNMSEAGEIVRSLAPLSLHGFGVKLTGLESFCDVLVSADSMAWSYAARNDFPIQGCSHKSCANCIRYAMRWHDQVLARLGQLRLEVPCPAAS